MVRAGRRFGVAAVVFLGALAPPGAGAEPVTPTKTVDIVLGGGNGRGRIQSPGRSCADGGLGAYWHADQVAELAPGALTSLPGELSFLLELHSESIRRPNSVNLPPPGPAGGPPTAFLPAGQSELVLANQRGTIHLALAGVGSCEAAAIDFNGRNAAGTAPWRATGTGSYAGINGIGTVGFSADVDPGANNPWQVDLDGTLAVLQPALHASVVDTYWGNLGTDYVTRRVSVTYRIKNTGPGDAFNAKLMSTTSPTNGVTPLGPHKVPLGDLHAGETRDVTVRYQLGVLNPCGLVILNCDFVTKVNVSWTDALDLPSQPSVGGLATKAPALPPVLP
jgi:hypothetical protein